MQDLSLTPLVLHGFTFKTQMSHSFTISLQLCNLPAGQVS